VIGNEDRIGSDTRLKQRFDQPSSFVFACQSRSFEARKFAE
jgi:hypothetical protein